MRKVTFNGKNTSISKYGHRFEPGKPLMIADEIAEKLDQEDHFTVEDVQSEPAAPSKDDGNDGKGDEPSLTELKEQAKAAGIKGYSSMNKQELTDALAALPQKDDPYANAPTS
ncbi:Rho termination factor N-terminal domain-containing protein [Paenibacillus xylanexedens]|uniref:Rho termination factor N-terminal domain-containing protein n=1 Tax=Paenibacillus xylanexedens TaxID=528191 RepID=UPI0011AACE5A|nr:Rho termination factor N-terminal domain-containing protein [Paenibacillus xylanexedens]